MFKTPLKNPPFYILLWLLITLASQPAALAQGSKLVWWQRTWDALKDNLIGDSGAKSTGIYLPPSYEFSQKRYPVIYVLHGFGGNAKSLTNKVKSAMDRMIQNEEIGEMIAVFVDGSNRFDGSQYISSPTIGDYETYIVRDVVNFIDANYRTIPHRDSRGITGFSMGGYGSMHLALKYPDVFSVVVAQAGTYNFSDYWVENFVEVVGAIVSLGLEILPEDQAWELFDKLPLPARNGLAYLAAVAPNPDKPPFYLDMPYEVDGLWFRRVDEVWERIIENDIIHELDRALDLPVKLNGIKLVHGTKDETAFLRQGRALDRAMTNLGINHEYEEHNDGHTFIAEKSLEFLSNHLAFEAPPDTPDGSGAASVSPASVAAHSDGTEMVITYTAEGRMRGGAITVHVASGWTPPQGIQGLPGYTTVTSTGMLGDVTFTKHKIQVDIQTLMPGDTITVTYGSGGGNSGATTSAARIATFIVSSASRSDRTLKLIGQSPLVTVVDPDVNSDGVVNILDLVLVASDLGDEGLDLVADVNGDGIVNIQDLVLVAGAFGNVAAAPSSNPRALTMLTATDVGQWLAQTQTLNLTDATSQRGVLFLERLLATLAPKETVLLPNYPNPFNPETWIPYRLAEDAFVTLTIYDQSGRIVRTLEVGHRMAAFYESRSKAIYWDGRNEFGEQMASGVYFYHLSAGDYSATRKMLIIK